MATRHRVQIDDCPRGPLTESNASARWKQGFSGAVAAGVWTIAGASVYAQSDSPNEKLNVAGIGVGNGIIVGAGGDAAGAAVSGSAWTAAGSRGHVAGSQ